MFAASESPCLQSSVYSLLAIGFMCPHVPSSVLAQEVRPKQPHAPSKSRQRQKREKALSSWLSQIDPIIAMMVRSLSTDQPSLLQKAIENIMCVSHWAEVQLLSR